jgi:hypothetical protein
MARSNFIGSRLENRVLSWPLEENFIRSTERLREVYRDAIKLTRATAGSFQLSTDGLRPYRTVIPLVFHDGIEADYFSKSSSTKYRLRSLTCGSDKRTIPFFDHAPQRLLIMYRAAAGFTAVAEFSGRGAARRDDRRGLRKRGRRRGVWLENGETPYPSGRERIGFIPMPLRLIGAGAQVVNVRLEPVGLSEGEEDARAKALAAIAKARNT